MSKGFRKLYITSGACLFVIGAAGLFLPFLPIGYSNDIEYLSALAETRTLTNNISISESPTATPDPNLPSIKNRLIIPSIGVNMPIFESEKGNVLAKGGWVFPSSIPGKGSNTVIFGHRFRYLPPISNTFYHLDKIKVGDIITVVWQGQKYEYSVRDMSIIEPTDLSVLSASTEEQITLITCAPLFSTKQRLVVTAALR